jgi:predicted metal-dependent enzyme (double-stranded beta helix superfamily)
MLDLDEFIADCRAALAQESPAAAIRDLTARAVSRPATVAGWFGVPCRGGLFPLHQSPQLTVLNVVWTPGMTVYPHEHRMWAVIGLYGGREDNAFYRRGPQGLVTAGGKRLERGDTTLLGESIIHAVSNPLTEFTGAIHIYGGDFFGTPRSEWSPDTFTERPFDIERARRTFDDANERWSSEGRRP